MIYIAGIVISFFLSVLLLVKKNRSPADTILMLWILFITLHQIYFYFDHSVYLRKYPAFIGFDFPLPLLHGPFLYLYAAALVGRIPEKITGRLLHFMPALLCFLYMIKFYLLTGPEKYYIIDHNGEGYNIFLRIRYFAIILSGIVYVLLTVLLLAKHQKKIRDNFSDIEKINLTWLQYLTYGIGIIWLAVIFGTDSLTFLAVVIYVLFMGIYGIRQTPVFAFSHQPGNFPESGERFPQQENTLIDDAASAGLRNAEDGNKELLKIDHPDDPATGLNMQAVKYRKSGINIQDIKAIHMRLEELMLREKLFTQPEITLGEVAQKLDIHPNYLSQVINAALHKNFYDYINSQRVEEFIKIVKDPQNRHFTLLALAYQCGFNSKTSFNRNFRKAHGVSPSAYLHTIHVVLEEVE